MKKQALICALLATVLLPGCSEDGENTPQPTDGRVALEATSGIRMNTRAYDKTWEAGDAKVEGKDKTDPKVAFVFTHKLVKLDITIKADGTSLTDADLAGTTVSISNQQTAATYNVVTGGDATVTTGTTKEIVLHTDGLKAEGIVLPAASTAGMALTFTVPGLEGQAFHWDVNSAAQSKAFVAGSKYLYTITISKAGVEVSSKVEDWTPGNGGGETGNAE